MRPDNDNVPARMRWSAMSRAGMFAERVDAVEDLAGLSVLLAEVARELGFAHHALADHDGADGASPTALFLHDYPCQWVSAFALRALHRIDPVRQAAARRIGGFAWHELSGLVALAPCQVAMLAEAREAGLGEGFTVPLHGPGMREASCSFVTRPDEAFPGHALHAAECIAHLAFRAASRLLHARSQPRLTSRQRQCVALVADGKTDWEIGVILGLSEETVGKYLDAARMRLGVVRRTQLVAIALRSGEMTRDGSGWR